MKKLSTLLMVFIIALSINAQDDMSAEDMAAAGQAAWMEFMTPGPQHEMLAKGAGEWTITNKYWFAPGTEPTITEGSAVGTAIMGGRYLQTTHKGTVMGMPFEGMSLEAYDNALGKYISIWVDNLGTGVAYAEGSLDKETGKIVYEGTMTDPMTKKGTWFKQTMKVVDENTHHFEMFMKGPDGKEFRNMEIIFTRKTK